jgi:hypothetical protein
MPTHEAKSNDEVDVPLLSRSHVVTSKFIQCACRCSPMHSRDSQSQEASYDGSSPYEVHPVAAPMEEEAE